MARVVTRETRRAARKDAKEPGRAGGAVRRIGRSLRAPPLLALPLLALALLSVGTCLLPPAARAAEDEVVPGGVWLLRLEAAREHQREALGADSITHPLRYFVLPRPVQRAAVTGDIERDVSSAEAQATFGLSDRWNLALAVPYREIRQTSTLATASTDAGLTGRLAGLQSRTVSGLGDVRLTLLHRPLFTDTDAITLGYGVIFPGSDPQSPYIGRSTLETANPYLSFHGIFRYTRYLLSVERARFDLRFHVKVAQDATVRIPDGRKVLLDPPNAAGVALGWEREFETLAYGIFLTHESSTDSQLDNTGQGDISKETRLAAQIAWGNLAGLETGRMTFPFQAGLKADAAVHGAYIPWGTRYSAFFLTYF